MANKILMITGGGRGIGHCTAVLAAQRGWDVCVNYLSNSVRADQTVELVRKHGARGLAVQADVSKEGDIVRLFQTCDRELGRLDGLVISAGIVGPRGRVDELTDVAGLDTLWTLNITSTLLCSREAIRRMSTKHGGKGGAIVNLSSAAAHLGTPGVSVPYAASKAAVDAITWGLGQEVAAEGIRVNSVSPGIIDTEIQPPGRIAEMGPKLPMRRAGQPEEVAAPILFLLSEEASYIAAAKVHVSGAR